MLIHELAQKTELNPHTIRFYEKMGLIKGERLAAVKTNKYFHYTDETVEKLTLIRDAKAVGFTLTEIKELLEAWYTQTLTKAQKLDILQQKGKLLAEKIEHLKAMQTLLESYAQSIANDEC